MMNLVEELLAPDDVPAYLGVLMDKVQTDRYPSLAMIRRLIAPLLHSLPRSRRPFPVTGHVPRNPLLTSCIPSTPIQQRRGNDQKIGTQGKARS
jgi:hypothetical protein